MIKMDVLQNLIVSYDLDLICMHCEKIDPDMRYMRHLLTPAAISIYLLVLFMRTHT